MNPWAAATTTSDGSRLARSRRLWLMFVVAVGFGAVLVAPYLSLNMQHSRLAVRNEAHYAVLVVHVFGALIALVLGPLQFVPMIRARRGWHRRIGRVYLLAGVLPGAVAGIPVALWSTSALTQVGLSIPALGWLVTGGLAYRAARRRDFVRHRNWMMRNYALTFLAVTSRVLVPLLLIVQLPFNGGSPIGDRATSMIPVGQVLGWIANLIVVEALIRRRRRREPVVGEILSS